MERIECAAIKYRLREESEWSVVTGHRHSDCVRKFSEMGVPLSARREIQGFVTSTGRFVDRKIALRIAVRSGQLGPVPSSRSELCSEDIY